MVTFAFLSTHQMFFSVFLRPQKNDEALWSKYAEQQTIARGKDGKNLNSNCIFSRRTDIGRNKSHPNSTENQHAEGDQFGLVKVVWKFSGKKSQEETGAAQ